MSEEQAKQVWDNLFAKLNDEEKIFLAVANNEKNKEIERLKIIEEKYKDSQLYIKDFKQEIERKSKMLINRDKELLTLNQEIERLNNIIKEVRELADTLDDNEDYIGQFIRQDILDILDKVDKEK